jgi:hypothetical protein
LDSPALEFQDVGTEAETEKTSHTFMSLCQSAGQDHNTGVTIAVKFCGNVDKLKYSRKREKLEITMTKKLRAD